MEERVKMHRVIGTILVAALAVPVVMSTSKPAAQVASESAAAPSVDFEFFTARVEPIFLKKRPGHARCYYCHSSEENPATFHLQKLSSGSTFWTEEQSRLNFESASSLVVPGQPTVSRLLIHPLAPDAGGDPVHPGGRQFASQNDPDWLTLAEWVRGQKTEGSFKK
jgi:hypothetical protein